LTSDRLRRYRSGSGGAMMWIWGLIAAGVALVIIVLLVVVLSG
jgi:hypothetical protein